jgi:hypothetical protein
MKKMENNEIIKDEQSIAHNIYMLKELQSTMQNNLNLLNQYNNISHLIDSSLVYEITRYTDNITLYGKKSNMEIVINGVKKYNTYDTQAEIFKKVNGLIKILFTDKSVKQNEKNIEYFGPLADIDNLTTLSLGYQSEWLIKESFNFDLINNEITIKEETIKDINKKFTTHLNKKQVKLLEHIKSIDNHFNEMIKMYDDRGDHITYSIYNNLFYCYTSNDLATRKSLDLFKVYNNILTNTKD